MTETTSFSFTAQQMIAPSTTRWQRFLIRLRLRKAPALIQPEGTLPLMFETNVGGIRTRYYFPAARPDRAGETE